MILRSGLRLVVVDRSVADKIGHYSSIPENSTEADGVLIGGYRGPHIEIRESAPTD
jgi:hypothetical protein